MLLESEKVFAALRGNNGHRLDTSSCDQGIVEGCFELAGAW